MTRRYASLAFTPSVQALQQREGSRAAYARMAAGAGTAADVIDEDVRSFLAEADHAFVATVSETGWPYVQHRGGPRGFLRVVGPSRIAFADFRGNRQFVSAGNVSRDSRASMIIVDWPRRRRLKLAGRLAFAAAEEADRDLVDAVALPGYPARIERVATFDLEAWDWNCPQHIVPRYTPDEVERVVAPLEARITELEAALAAARG
jgi:uncharacterized protein